MDFKEVLMMSWGVLCLERQVDCPHFSSFLGTEQAKLVASYHVSHVTLSKSLLARLRVPTANGGGWTSVSNVASVPSELVNLGLPILFTGFLQREHV